MNNTLSKAELELEILCQQHPNEDNPPIVKQFIPEILALVKKFGESGQSGGSAPYTANAIAQTVKALCLHEPICDITGVPEEWSEVEHGMAQNKRCYALLKHEDGKPYYLDAIAWKTPNGSTWSGQAKLSDGRILLNRAYIKGYPFKPKTFIIDVLEEEVAKDDWEYTVKDEAQLKEVFEYYDPFYFTKKEKPAYTPPTDTPSSQGGVQG